MSPRSRRRSHRVCLKSSLRRHSRGETMSDGEITGPNDPTAPRALLLLGQNSEQARQFHNQPEHWALLAGHFRAAPLSARVMTDDVSVLTSAELSRYDVIL